MDEIQVDWKKYPRCAKFMHARQKEHIETDYPTDEDKEWDYILDELEDKLEKVPTREQKEWIKTSGNYLHQVVHAHYFLGDSHWFITQYEKNYNNLWGYVVLNGDTDMSELGAISLEELTTMEFTQKVMVNGRIMSLPVYPQLDFHWEPVYITEALHEKFPDAFPKSDLFFSRKPRFEVGDLVENGGETFMVTEVPDFQKYASGSYNRFHYVLKNVKNNNLKRLPEGELTAAKDDEMPVVTNSLIPENAIAESLSQKNTSSDGFQVGDVVKNESIVGQIVSKEGIGAYRVRLVRNGKVVSDERTWHSENMKLIDTQNAIAESLSANDTPSVSEQIDIPSLIAKLNTLDKGMDIKDAFGKMTFLHLPNAVSYWVAKRLDEILPETITKKQFEDTKNAILETYQKAIMPFGKEFFIIVVKQNKQYLHQLKIEKVESIANDFVTVRQTVTDLEKQYRDYNADSSRNDKYEVVVVLKDDAHLIHPKIYAIAQNGIDGASSDSATKELKKLLQNHFEQNDKALTTSNSQVDSTSPFWVELSSTANADFMTDWNGTADQHKKIKGQTYYPVESLSQARDLVQKFIVTYDLGGGNFTGGRVVDAQFNFVARVSYNGRLWSTESNATTQIEINEDGTPVQLALDEPEIKFLYQEYAKLDNNTLISRYFNFTAIEDIRKLLEEMIHRGMPKFKEGDSVIYFDKECTVTSVVGLKRMTQSFIYILHGLDGKLRDRSADEENMSYAPPVDSIWYKEEYRIPTDINELRAKIVEKVRSWFEANEKKDMKDIKKLAAEFGVDDLNAMYEWVELAWTLHYRKIIDQNETSIKSMYDEVVAFYQNIQPTYSAKDSNKRIFQQYSTAAPISFLAGWFANANKAASIFEPSAGNGLLTIFATYEKTTVNEIDRTRLENLKSQPFKKVMSQDATLPFTDLKRTQQAVLCNPPFGDLDDVEYGYDGYPIKKLDLVMIAHALDTMIDKGRAALIVGGHTKFTADGLIQTHRPFFNWLYENYNVCDMINIDSKKLYAKQGTGFPLRLILIAGRKGKSITLAPTLEQEPNINEEVHTFEDLYIRVHRAKNKALEPVETLEQFLKLSFEQLKIAIL